MLNIENHKQEPKVISQINCDWEFLFEDKINGIISLISSLESVSKLKKSLHVVIDSLYVRKTDGSKKQALNDFIENMGSAQGASSIEEIKKEALIFLREIKENRIKKAASRNRFEDQGRSHKENLKSELPSITEEPLSNRFNDIEVEFINAFCQLIQAKMDVLIVSKAIGSLQLPFILSGDFAKHFTSIVRNDFAPILIQSFKRYLSSFENTPDNKIKGIFDKDLKEASLSQSFLRSWDICWNQNIEQSTLPSKPKQTAPKKNLLGMVKKTSEVDKKKYQTTIKKWENNRKQIMTENIQAKINWDKIRVETQDYHAPIVEDKQLLKDILALDTDGLQTQINAYRQTVEQGGDLNALFESFKYNNNVDLALLAVSYQCPSSFLKSNSALKNIVSSLSPSEKEKKLPLILRYLTDYI